MWRSIGSVTSSDKHNKSREDNNYEPFAQASRLKLNQSQLSGQASPHFLNQYFVKKRSSEGMLQRVLSQKNIESRPFVSPPSSMKDVGSPRIKLKTENNEIGIKGGNSLQNNDKISIEGDMQRSKRGNKQKEMKCEFLKEQLKVIREEQQSLQKKIKVELNAFRSQMKQTEQQISNRLEKADAERQKQKKQSFNPQLLNKLRQQSSKFSQKMKQLDNRKDQVKQKYRSRLEQL